MRLGINTLYRAQRGLKRITHNSMENTLGRLSDTLGTVRDLNAKAIVSGVHHRFREQVARSGLPASQLAADEKEWKKTYSRGRKELEHEFGKVMRHKSIRSLASGETGEVIADLKPIWLMSPLSVSDTLPLETDAFDLVVFDEASQITLEEAIPALFRAKQSVVVGDECSNYRRPNFSAPNQKTSRRMEDEDDSGALALQADSFLSHAAGTLKATMLGWHYRSRYEQLIDFSNANFYQRRLLTIPNVTIPPQRCHFRRRPSQTSPSIAP